MMYVVENPTLVLLFFTVPFVGWLLYESVNKRVIAWVGIFAFIIFLPAFSGYTYVVANIYPLMLYISLSCLYSFVFYPPRNIIAKLIIPTIALFVILGFTAFVGTFAGTIAAQQRWELKGYRVEYIRDKGFSGGALMTYQLYKYSAIPIFMKQVDTKVDTDTTNNCNVTFAYRHFSFNKCTN
jgi:hypothetical protein